VKRVYQLKKQLRLHETAFSVGTCLFLKKGKAPPLNATHLNVGVFPFTPAA